MNRGRKSTQPRAWLWRADKKQFVWRRRGRLFMRHPRAGLVRVLSVFQSEGVTRIAWRHCGVNA
jgi:hypothetical protein